MFWLEFDCSQQSIDLRGYYVLGLLYIGLDQHLLLLLDQGQHLLFVLLMDCLVDDVLVEAVHCYLLGLREDLQQGVKPHGLLRCYF